MDSDALMDTAGRVFFNTNMAAAVACCTTLLFTWIRYKKPDVSMTYNAALAGLVGITAGCDAVSPVGAAVIGIICGILIVLAVEFFDKIAKIDDPVGAVSVHCVCGATGTILTGLFATGVTTEAGLFMAAESICWQFRQQASSLWRYMWRLLLRLYFWRSNIPLGSGPTQRMRLPDWTYQNTVF